MQNEYNEKLNRLIPGGAHTYSKGSDQFPSNCPPIFRRGRDAYLYDINETKYLDYGMGLRSVTIGYANEEINKGVIEQIENGNNLTRPSLIELEAAETITKLIPYAEMVKFAKNGSNVTTASIKLARAYTGRKYIAVCKNHPFFSFDDWFIGSTVIKKGIPEEIYKLTLTFTYNDLESLDDIFSKYEIACVIMEPTTTDPPKVYDDGKNFLQKVKELCVKYGAIFILDEMITGFRFHMQGASTMFNVVPDLATFGKGIANGFALSALVGRRDIMKCGGIDENGMERTFLLSTTHGATMDALGAFIGVVNFYNKFDVIGHIRQYGCDLIKGMKEIINEFELDDYFEIYGYEYNPYYITRDNTKKPSLEFRTLFSQEMIKNKVIMPWIGLSYSHNSKELDMTLGAFRKALKVYNDALKYGVDNYLNGNIIKPVFRQFN